MEQKSMQSLNAKSFAVVFLVVVFGITVFIWNVPVIMEDIEFPLTVIRTLDIICFVLFPISFIAFLSMIINVAIKPPISTSRSIEPQVRICWDNLPLKSIACFIISFSCTFMINGIMSSSLRNTVTVFLDDIATEVDVKVNEKFVKNPKEIVRVLREVQPLPDHHSHATKPIQIKVISNTRSLLVELSRDSQRPQEYWVFYPALFSHTTRIEIGRIITNLFDDY